MFKKLIVIVVFLAMLAFLFAKNLQRLEEQDEERGVT